LKPTPDLRDVQGAAAQSYEMQPDGLTYVFHLRKTARWSDGQPVKARDFLYGWKRVLDPRLGASYAQPLDQLVAGAQDYPNVDPKNVLAVSAFLDGLGLFAPDDQTFEVKLQRPTGYFKWAATIWTFAPLRQDIVEKYGSAAWATVPAQIIGNGPFRVSEMTHNHYTLVPNDFYWAGKPKLGQLIFYFVSDPREGFRLYRSGKLDVTEVPLANALLIQDDPALRKEIHRSDSLNTSWLQMNTGHAPFDNPKVREAVARAIDRQALNRYIGHGQYDPRQTLIPRGMNGYHPDLGAPQSFDPAAARRVLGTSGASQQALNRVRVLVPGLAEHETEAEFIIGQIKANLGLSWTMDAVPLDGSRTYGRRARTGDYEVAIAGWLADYPDDQE
jgi:oligopeptide transport system substrate-binding protein